MSSDALEFQYLKGQFRPDHPALHAQFEARSAAVVAREACSLELRYGALERQTFDFFPAPQRARATLAYFHPGYWQWRDKAAFRFIAPTFTALGLNVALVNYPLCPSVRLAEVTASARLALAAIALHAGAGLPLIAAGHSAGGHLAVELGLTPWSAHGLPDGAVAGVIALSGLYDIEPLRHTSLNLNLKLDADSARAGSPLHRVRPDAPAALIAVGADETPAMCAQSCALHAAWRAAGNDAALHLDAGTDHFSLLLPLTTPGSALHDAVRALLVRALGPATATVAVD